MFSAMLPEWDRDGGWDRDGSPHVKRGGNYYSSFSSSSCTMGSEVDYFDGLPDSVLHHVFNKLADIKALGRCRAVSRRFKALASQVENVVVKVDCMISAEEEGAIDAKGKGILNQIWKCFLGSLAKPIQALQQLLVGPPRKPSPLVPGTEVSHHSPGEVLRNFTDVRHLLVELPAGELGLEEGALLKWRAEFGTTLESCVIVGASSVVKKPLPSNSAPNQPNLVIADEPPPGPQDIGSIPESFYVNGGLKLRVVWTISSLITASARHFLMQPIVIEHPTLESVVLTDSDGQGTLRMNKEQLHEFRSKPSMPPPPSNRTQVPALHMKLWYAPCLDLPDGTNMRGATLIAIRPNDQPVVRKESDEFIAGAFEEPFKSAATALVRGRTYLLEMNSF